MTLLRKDEEDPNVFKATPPELRSHPLFSGQSSVGIMTADAPRFHASDPTGHEGLVGQLKKMGLRHEVTHGKYGAEPEKSVVVYHPTREQMYRLGHRFGQEAVIYSQNGRHEMLYTHGPRAGKFHPAASTMRFSHTQPEDYYTHLPGRGFITLHFQDDKLSESPIRRTMPLEDQARADDAPVTKSEIAAALATTLRKSIGSPKHPHSYDWHEGHTSYHKHALHGGVLLNAVERAREFQMAKTDGLTPTGAATPAPSPGTETKTHNEQAAGVGVGTYAKYAHPYGSINKGSPSNLKFYPMGGTGDKVNGLLKQHGFQVHYAGGKHGKADLANKNYNTGHLMIWDPSAGSGGDFGEHDYTDNWRKMHELAHALTYPQLNQKYGEGRRMGGLGKQRSPREAKRAVEWEWLAAHKQRELGQQVGIHVSDEDFHRELNTVMHDAVHRAVTGKFTEPGDEGFVPHPHKVPLENALGMVDEAANGMGLQDQNAVLKKFLAELTEVLQKSLRGTHQ